MPEEIINICEHGVVVSDRLCNKCKDNIPAAEPIVNPNPSFASRLTHARKFLYSWGALTERENDRVGARLAKSFQLAQDRADRLHAKEGK